MSTKDSIACFEDIEEIYLDLLESEGEGNLLNRIADLRSSPEPALRRLTELFNPIVDPHFLSAVDGNWIGFVLWDEFAGEFRILVRHRNTHVSEQRFTIVSDFLQSRHFREKGFVEPMTDIIFNQHTKTRALTIVWPRLAQKSSSVISPGTISERLSPITINLENLNRIEMLDKRLETLAKEIDRHESVQSLDNIFTRLADDIAELADTLLTDEIGSEAMNEATNEIRAGFSLEREDSPDSPFKDLATFRVALTRVLLWNRLFDDSWEYLYFLPARFFEGIAVSGVVFASQHLLDPHHFFALGQIVNRIFAPFHFGFSIAKTREHALRSAIAAIMGRNMSHNIGSHVLARLSTEKAVSSALFPGLTMNDTLELATKRLARMTAFLRTRMDFVADISTTLTAPPPTKLPFMGEIIVPFVDQFLLWKHLCASYNLRENNIFIQIQVNGFAGPRVSMRSPIHSLQNYPIQLRTLDAAIPNGNVGCQALYSVIENFIRNSAKHTERQEVTDLTVLLNVETNGNWAANTKYYKLTLSDDWQACQRDKDLLDLVSSMNKKIKAPIIKTDGSVSITNRGLKEMKAAAAYLRRLAPSGLEDADLDPPLLKAVNFDGNLGYEFYLLCPKDLLVLAPGLSISDVKMDALLRQGISIVDDVNRLFQEAPDYSILVVIDPDSKCHEALNALDTVCLLPLRMLIKDKNKMELRSGAWSFTKPLAEGASNPLQQLMQFLEEGDGASALNEVWQLWITLTARNSTKLWISENQKKDDWMISDLARSVGDKDEPANELVRVALYAAHGHPHQSSNNLVFYEPFVKGDPVSFVLETPPQDAKARKILAQELLNAALTSVIIVDERVQEAVHSIMLSFAGEGRTESAQIAPTEPLGAYLEKMNIHCPPLSLNLESKNLRQDAVDKWLEDKTNELTLSPPSQIPPLLVVHQGILDTIGLENPRDSEKWVQNWKQTRKISEVVITSGRGTPDNTPGNARFLPLSVVLLYTTERKSKLHLVRGLAASRRVKQ